MASKQAEGWENIGTWYPNTSSERAVNVIVLFVNVICLVGNIFFWTVWYNDKSLRKSTKSLLYLNISFFDVVWALFQICVKSYNIHHSAFASGVWSCQANSILNNVCQAISMQTLMLVSVERWMSIVKERQARPSDTYIMIANSWIVAIVFTILNVAASGNRPILAASHTYCDPNWMNPAWYQKFMGYFTIISYVSFVFIMSYCYYTIFCKFRASVIGLGGLRTQVTSTVVGRNALENASMHAEELPELTGALSKESMAKLTWSKGSVEILATADKSESRLVLSKLGWGKGVEGGNRNADSSANDERQRRHAAEERALIRKFAILVLTFAVTWGVWVFLILIPETITNRMADQNRDILAAIMFPVNAALTPYLFIFLDNRFKAAAKTLLRLA